MKTTEMDEESSKKKIFSFVWKEFCKKRKEDEIYEDFCEAEEVSG